MRRRTPQSGYALLLVLIAVTLLSIALAAAVPAIKTQIRREQEIELQHRGDQYVKAIKHYYHKFGRYPASIEQLESTNNLRFLRKRYKDPVTGKDDWRIIHLGEAKYPPKLKGLAGVRVGQQIGQNIGTGVGANIGGGLNQALNTNPSQAAPVNTAGQDQSYNDPNNPKAGVGSQSGPQTGGVGLAQNGEAPGQVISGVAQSGVGQGGQPVIGVSIPSTRKSLRVYNERKQYNEWEFVYDPRIEALKNEGGGALVRVTPVQNGQASPQQNGSGNTFQLSPNGNTPAAPNVPQPMPQ